MKTNNTMDQQTKEYFRNVYGSYENLCEMADERLATLRAELQEYHDNNSKGGSQRKRNMQWLQEDIKKLEQMKEDSKQAFTFSNQKQTAMKTTKITFFGGFHNADAATIRVSNDTANEIREGFYSLDELLTNYQLRRLNRHFCGVEGCQCGGVLRAEIEF